ncbi:hypothetical protein J2Y56_003906 [Pseudomonas sp. BE134]|nr:hypothetical protein [Pseudomonas sp. BE134]
MLNSAIPTAFITLSPKIDSMANQYGDDCFLIQEPIDGKFYTVSFEWNCSMSKRVFA